MASVVLTAVGGAVGGPIGAAIGNVVGQQIDGHVLFRPKGREGPRLSDLAMQGSDYGSPLPRHYGTVRSAGTVIWSSGLKETAHRSGGGKRSGGRTTTYSYSASFAVAFAGRRIERVNRIWADGKLLRGAAGDMLSGGTVRIYQGTERQRPDPLLQAELGIGSAPAFRGLAYAVFQDLQLADYANRIPNLSFEIVADGSATGDLIVGDLVRAVGGRADASGLSGEMTGYSASRNSDLAAILAGLSVVTPFSVSSSAEGLKFSVRRSGDRYSLNAGSLLPDRDDRKHIGERRRTGEETLPGALTLTANDPSRDYQPSVQRAVRAGSGGLDIHFDLPASLTAPEAKQVAEAQLAEMWGRRADAVRRLPLSALVLEPGDLLSVEEEAIGGGDWHVRQTAVEALGLTVQLERRRGRRASCPPPIPACRCSSPTYRKGLPS
ncbi:phage tail protein [Pacificimonas sp. ICDLI1SI03]